jgi:hypothetical protein
MVGIVDVRVAMDHRIVAMRVGVGSLSQLCGRVFVLMVLVVDVLVRVFQGLVLVPVVMPIGREQERAPAHGHERH